MNRVKNHGLEGYRLMVSKDKFFIYKDENFIKLVWSECKREYNSKPMTECEIQMFKERIYIDKGVKL